MRNLSTRLVERSTGAWASGPVADRLLAAGVAAIQVAGTLLAAQEQPDRRSLDVLGIALLIASAAALVARRRHPVAVLGAAFVTALAFAAWMLMLLAVAEFVRVRRDYQREVRRRAQEAEHAHEEEARRRQGEE